MGTGGPLPLCGRPRTGGLQRALSGSHWARLGYYFARPPPQPWHRHDVPVSSKL